MNGYSYTLSNTQLFFVVVRSVLSVTKRWWNSDGTNTESIREPPLIDNLQSTYMNVHSYEWLFIYIIKHPIIFCRGEVGAIGDVSIRELCPDWR